MDNELQSQFKCDICGKESKSKSGLRLHQRKHQAVPAKPASPEIVKADIKQVVKPGYNLTKYQELPLPIVEHLKITFGNWLNFMEIGQVWKQDFGGYGMYIKVPQRFSTEWKEVDSPIYDNQTLKMISNQKLVQEDIRWKPIKDPAEVKKWIDLVKKNIIENAYRKGLQLPTTNTGLDENNQTREQYEAMLAGQPA